MDEILMDALPDQGSNFQKADSNDNLAFELDESQKKRITKEILEDLETDLESRQGWIDLHSEYAELYHQKHIGQTPDFDWMNSDSLPILTEGCNMFQSRAYKAFFPNRDFIQAMALDGDDDLANEAAERVAKYYSNELTVKDRNYKRDKNAMFLATALHGSDFTKVYFDPQTGKKVVERVRAEDLVVPYGCGMRRIEDLPRKAHIIRIPIHVAGRMAQSGYFTDPVVRSDAEYDSISSIEAGDESDGLTNIRNHGKSFFGEIIESHCWLNIGEDEIDLPYIAVIDRTAKRLIRLQRRYNDQKQPIEYFTHYSFLPNPDGFYGLGLGHLAAPINKICNTMLRQVINAATLANEGNCSGFVSQDLNLAGTDLELKLGRFPKIARRADDVRNSIFQFNFPGANPALVDMMQFMQGIAQRLISATDVVAGDMDKVLQPVTIMTMLDSSLQLPTSVMEQMAISFEEELSKLFELDRQNINYLKITKNSSGEPDILPEDFRHELKIMPIIDPRNITKQQRVMKAQQLYQFVMENPLLSQNPETIKAATGKVLEAMEIADIDSLMPPPPEPENINDQHIENMYFLLPPEERPDFDVYPDQDHAGHIVIIDELLALLDESQTPNIERGEADESVLTAIINMGDQIKQEIASELMLHRRKHMAYLYGQEQGVLNGQGKTGSMEESARNSMGNSTFESTDPTAEGLVDMPVGEGGVLSGAELGVGDVGNPYSRRLPEEGIVGVASLDYGGR